MSASSILLSRLKKLGFADWIRELSENLVEEICINVHRCHLSFTLCFVNTAALDLVSSLARIILLLPNSSVGKRYHHLKIRMRTLLKDIFRHVSCKLEGSIFLSTAVGGYHSSTKLQQKKGQYIGQFFVYLLLCRSHPMAALELNTE